MATRTTTLELWKPDLNDPISPTMFNQNSDIIDNWAASFGTPAKIAKGSYIGTGATKSWYTDSKSFDPGTSTQCFLYGLACGSGKIVTLVLVSGSYSNDVFKAYTSSDGGTAWSNVGLTRDSTNYSMSDTGFIVTYENGAFYIVIKYKKGSTNYFEIHRSTDGTTWTKVYDNSSNTSIPYNFMYANSVYLIICSDSILRSTNGTSWTKITPSISGYSTLSGINMAYGNNMFIGLIQASDGTNNKTYRIYSSDGSTWAYTDTGGYYVDAIIFYKNSSFYMLSAGNVYSSTSGIGWTYVSKYITPDSMASATDVKRELNGVTFCGVYCSKDLIEWDSVNTRVKALNIGYDGTNYFALTGSTRGYITTSYPGTLYTIPTTFLDADKTINNLPFTPKVILFQRGRAEVGASTADTLNPYTMVITGDRNLITFYQDYISSSHRYDMAFVTISQNSFSLRHSYSSYNNVVCVDEANTKYTYIAIG